MGTAGDAAEQELHVYQGLMTVLDRRAVFLEVVADAPTVDEARERLRRQLGLSEIQAAAALDLQMRRLTAAERLKVARRLAELQDHVAHRTS